MSLLCLFAAAQLSLLVVVVGVVLAVADAEHLVPLLVWM